MKGIALVMLISLAIFSAVTGWGLMAFLSAFAIGGLLAPSAQRFLNS